jgi:hypothetical protein
MKRRTIEGKRVSKIMKKKKGKKRQTGRTGKNN